MNHHNIIQEASMRAQLSLGYDGMGLHHGGFGGDIFRELTELVRGTTTHSYLQTLREEEDLAVLAMDYRMEDFQEETPLRYHQEVFNTQKLIQQRQPHLKLFHVKGQEFKIVRGAKINQRTVDVYRIQAPDGYAFDYQLAEDEDQFGIKYTIAHVKFILQPDPEKQGSGLRMNRHISECADVLFNDGVYCFWGWARRMNQHPVRPSRHGNNWRSTYVRIKDAGGKPSPEMIRLLALYLRGGWILAGHQKEKDEQIVFCSPKAIQTMFARLGNDAANAFKYSKDYEKIITHYKIR